jgi:molybdate transport system substrate-binding protein
MSLANSNDDREQRMPRNSLLILILASLLMNPALQAGGLSVVHVFAAGSLRDAFKEIGIAFQNATGILLESDFGPSGHLRQRIENGEQPDLFASADMSNPTALSGAGKAGPVILFARNRLCALVRPGLAVTSDSLLSMLIDAQVKLGTSTPKIDPLGDYTWAMFAKADGIIPGSRATLEAKAHKLIGSPGGSPLPPSVKNVFAWHLREGHADVFIEYCSAGADFKKDMPDGEVVNLPVGLATGADYGLTVLPTKNDNTAALVFFILSQSGQIILARNGFEAPLLLPEQH